MSTTTEDRVETVAESSAKPRPKPSQLVVALGVAPGSAGYEGANSIKVSNPNGYIADIDWITV